MQLINSSSQVVNVPPDITKDKFIQILKEANSPAYEEASECYDAIIGKGVSPAFALGIFKRESQFGTDPNSIVVKYGTNNPGNCRSSTIGTMPLINTERGVFVKYPDWQTGFKDMANRLVADWYVYAQEGRKTITDIIYKWAPASDQGNDPAGYVRSVVTSMNTWISSEGSSSTTMEIIDLTANTPDSVYTDRGLPISELVLHDTAGSGDFNYKTPTELQALLDATIRWFQGGGGVSIHYLIGPEALGGKIYRLCKEQYAAYHVVGDKGPYTYNGVTCSKDNRIAIGIERFGQPNEAVGPNQRNAMLWLVADICQRNGLTANQVISHMSIQSDRRDGGVLLDAARQVVASGGLNYVTTENQKPVIPDNGVTQLNGKTLGGGFKQFYDKLAGYSPNLQLLTFGLPVTNEFDCDVNGDGKAYTVQLFERSGLIYEAANSSPWDVHAMTTSQLENALATAKAKSLLN